VRRDNVQHRWCDVNEEVFVPEDGEDPCHADYVGGVGDVDLWVSARSNVLICQYEDEDEYVSYYPVSAVLDHAKGVLTYENTPNLEGKFVGDPTNANKRLLWHGKDTSVVGHQPKEIARYLAVFYPDAFSQAEREEALGLDLAEQGEMK
jgi:hypothetical protein